MSHAIPPWAQGAAARWARAAETRVIADLAAGQPVDHLSPTLKHGRWKVIPYETVDGLAGAMLWASPLADAPALRIPLHADGPHAIFLGLFSTAEAPSVAWVGLESDDAPVMRRNSATVGYGNVADLFVRVADLRQETLVIRPQYPAEAAPCGVAWVKLIPLSDEEAAAWRADGAHAATHRLAATNDGFSSINRQSSLMETRSRGPAAMMTAVWRRTAAKPATRGRCERWGLVGFAWVMEFASLRNGRRVYRITVRTPNLRMPSVCTSLAFSNYYNAL